MAHVTCGAMPTTAWQRTSLAGVAAACLALPVPGVGVQLALAVPAIAVFGLPHGATDWALARSLWRPDHGSSWPIRFASFYGALMTCVALAAWLCPAPALAAFVLAAAWHFGAEDADALGLRRFWPEWVACGTLPVCAPALFWPGQTSLIVGLLGVQVAPPALRALGAACLLVWSAAALAAILRAPRARRRLAADLGLNLLLQAAAPPLLSFATYFCVLHGPRHLASLPRGLVGWAMLPVSLAAVLIIGGAVCLAPAHTAGLGGAGTTGLFWGLACLTAPHLALGRIAARRSAVPPFIEGMIS